MGKPHKTGKPSGGVAALDAKRRGSDPSCTMPYINRADDMIRISTVLAVENKAITANAKKAVSPSFRVAFSSERGRTHCAGCRARPQLRAISGGTARVNRQRSHDAGNLVAGAEFAVG
jgi:hypothetical protein